MGGPCWGLLGGCIGPKAVEYPKESIKVASKESSDTSEKGISESLSSFSAQASMRSAMRIGSIVPDMSIQTTMGDTQLHQWLTSDTKKPWTILFSHPKDFTPVGTTELAMFHRHQQAFAECGAKLIGLSCDSLEDHFAWSHDIAHSMQLESDELNFPLIADEDRSLVRALGMVDDEDQMRSGPPAAARALMILYYKRVKLVQVYPMSIGQNIEEVFRCLHALQLSMETGLHTPANWKPSERVMVDPRSDSKVAKTEFQDLHHIALPSQKDYMRTVQCPPMASRTTCH